MCDFISCSAEKSKTEKSKTMFLELKTTAAASMPLANLKKHQIVEMCKANEYKQVDAYFVFEYRKEGVVFAIKADKIYDFYKTGQRKSFTVKWCEENGTPISRTLKKTHYKYDVSPILN